MKKLVPEKIGRTVARSSAGFRTFGAATVVLVVSAAGTVKADQNQNSNSSPTTSTQNVNVVNTPTVNVGNTPTVNVGNTPTVTLSSSSAIKVANTTANPVPGIDIEKVNRIPYQSTQVPTGNCPSSAGGVQTCVFNFTPPAPGQRLVVERVNGVLLVAPGTTTPPFAVLANGVGPAYAVYWGFTGALGQGNGVAGQANFNEATLAYFNSSDSAPSMGVTANWIGGVGQYMTLVGYLENCSITGCPGWTH